MQGQHSPCLFQHPVTGVSIMVRSHDFNAVDSTKNSLAARKVLHKYLLEGKVLGKGEGCVEEVRIRNKVVRPTRDRTGSRPLTRGAPREGARACGCQAEQSYRNKVRDEIIEGDDVSGTRQCSDELEPDESGTVEQSQPG